jgi:hypothetical protein
MTDEKKWLHRSRVQLTSDPVDIEGREEVRALRIDDVSFVRRVGALPNDPSSGPSGRRCDSALLWSRIFGSQFDRVSCT